MGYLSLAGRSNYKKRYCPQKPPVGLLLWPAQYWVSHLSWWARATHRPPETVIARWFDDLLRSSRDRVTERQVGHQCRVSHTPKSETFQRHGRKRSVLHRWPENASPSQER